MEGRSRLQELWEKQTCGSGLTPEEKAEARRLINEAVLNDKRCWVCTVLGEEFKQFAIRDLGVCRKHALDALKTS